jgi:Putative metal-binding motif
MNRRRYHGRRPAAVLGLALGLVATLTACSDSALRIKLIFPDQASITRAERLALVLVDPDQGGWSCATARGRDAFGAALIDQRDFLLNKGAELTFPQAPMRSMLVSALVYDKASALFLTGCQEVQAEPGDDVEVLITLSAASDADGDGVDGAADCDDADPCRSPQIKEAGNFCSTAASGWTSKWTEACKAKLAQAGKAFTPPLCGDGVDQDCDGKDTPCFVDQDCDSYSPPNDCDDGDKAINPSAVEVCDGKDNNCNKAIDEGCLPCDVDGDQHGRKGYQGGACNLPLDDSDDYDAGIYPKLTADTAGNEGGSVLAALRRFCSAAKDKNGKRHRDVDHDGDGKPASADGCPAETCDKDGDGFKGAVCSPPKSMLDCDDADPTVFPGAPDLCGDGKAQNCVADAGCSCDKDGDKYCSPGDCDDTKAAVRPWATERCDRIDNDCDKLVDEGNPDALGALIPTTTYLCNDDNDGRCAPSCSGSVNCSGGNKLSGVCACSSLDTTKVYAHDPTGNRVVCKGEDLKGGASPRCFGATQPQLERCDKVDWDCDGKGFVTGQVFADKGKTCGVNTGSCKAGVVTGCDPSKSVPNAALVQQTMKTQGVAFNVSWACTPETLLPVPEVCNGKDDDCDGALGGSAEQDGDNDGFLACSGPCPTGSGRLDLSPAYKGCGDCADGASSVYPGAAELCNSQDDNCQSGVNDDGQDQCSGSSSCCSAQQACRQLGTDSSNCGSCGKVCDPATSSKCASGKCVCGYSSSACSSGLNCVGSSCTCIAGGNCSGCCSGGGNSCLSGSSTSACGINGAACKTCTAAQCKVPVCQSNGQCGTYNASTGTSCSGGKCTSGSCCTGCLNGATCYPGTTKALCGSNGDPCQSCAGSCITGSCI